MKKVAILAILGIAVSAHATAIKWSVGSFLYGVNDGTATQAYTVDDGFADDWKAGSPSFVLVYLGVNKAATTADKVTTDMIVQNVAASSVINQSTSTSKAGKANVAQTYSASDVVGATYQVFFSYDVKLKDIYTDSGMTTVAKNVVTISQDQTTEAFSAAPSPLYAAGGSGTSSYVAVPEPAVALLGLLGIGMLIKRRRA